MLGKTATELECKKRKIPAPDFTGHAGAVASCGSDFLVYISDQMTDPVEIVDTIIHESVHVKQALVEFIGETDVGAEFEAYTIAHIAVALMQEYERLSTQEKPDAVHQEGRDKGLQAGVQGVPLEAGTTEKPKLADCRTECGNL